MRKLAAAALALPVLALIYSPVVVRRLLAGRIGVGIGTLAISGIVLVGLAAPVTTSARPPVTVSQIGPAALAGSIEPHHGIRQPVRLTFSTAMDPKSVAAALTVTPAADVSLSWDAAGTSLTIAPKSGWRPGTYYTVTIAAAATDTTGQKLAAPARAIFTTRGLVGGRISASPTDAKGRVPTATTFAVTFDGPVDPAAAQAAFRIAPPVAGTFETSAPAAGATTITFVPTAPLAPDTAYTVSLTGTVVDADGIAAAPLAPISVRTAKGPSVVRFRPRAGTTSVARGASLSVRFTNRMDRASTGAAFSAQVGGKKLKGTIGWAEGDTVLVFQPATALPYGATVTMTVGPAATDRGGTPLNAPKTAAFRVEAKATAAKPVASSRTTHIGHGSSVGAGSWHAVEVYYLQLMNCTRGGGWVTSGGNCSSPGGSGIRPLILSAGISNLVSRPYAKFLVMRGICDHFADGDPGVRLRRHGFNGDYRENIGCEDIGNPYASVLGSHLFFQNEKPCGGYCHYANIMSVKMKYVGIGVWVYHRRVRLVVDFWEG